MSSQGLKYYMRRVGIVMAALVCTSALSVDPVPRADSMDVVVIDNFESDSPGTLPGKWKRLIGRSVEPLKFDHLNDNEHLEVVEEDGRQFLRVTVDRDVSRIVMPNADFGYHWNFSDHRRLRWDWRAVEVPEGAREDRDRYNDNVASLYVTFSVNFLGIPRSIKYSYSSTLPVGTIVRYTGLRVLIVASAKEEMGEWMTIERDVLADYNQIWGGTPPDEPISISLFSASNSTGSRAVADYDNIKLVP